MAHLAERPQPACRGDPEFLGEFPARGGVGIFAVVLFALRDRPGAKIAVAPNRPARMDEQNIKAGVAMTVHQDARAQDCHAVVRMRD